MIENETNRKPGKTLLTGSTLFRTVTFVFDAPDRMALSPKTKNIISWLNDFNSWFVISFSQGPSPELHLFYGREIGLLGANLLHFVPELKQIAATCVELGYAVNIALDADHIIENLTLFNDLMDSGLISSLGIQIAPDPSRSEDSAILTAIEQAAEKNVSLNISADPEDMFAIGTFDSALLSSMNITWYPLSSRNTSIITMPSNPVRPCYGRIRLHINAKGDIFPCLGLFGLDPFCMGNIKDPFADTLLSDEKVVDRIDTWIRSGPEINTISIPSIRFGLPAVCERHLAAFGQ